MLKVRIPQSNERRKENTTNKQSIQTTFTVLNHIYIGIDIVNTEQQCTLIYRFKALKVKQQEIESHLTAK